MWCSDASGVAELDLGASSVLYVVRKGSAEQPYMFWENLWTFLTQHVSDPHANQIVAQYRKVVQR